MSLEIEMAEDHYCFYCMVLEISLFIPTKNAIRQSFHQVGVLVIHSISKFTEFASKFTGLPILVIKCVVHMKKMTVCVSM